MSGGHAHAAAAVRPSSIVLRPDLDKLGRYEIEAVLGKGATAVVYRALDPVIGRTVAIKAVRRQAIDPSLADEVMTRFHNEARAAGRLMHPGIVGIYEYGEQAELAFIVMEYVDGRSLAWYLDNKTTFDLAQASAILSQMLDALEYAHERGVVHRDIKPANLMFTAAGRLKVADFGIARLDASSLTMVGVVMGTPSYMSPEQCKGFEVDRRSDLFSAGVVLYELLAGQKPFRGSVETVTYKICHEQPAPPSQLSQLALSPEVDQLVMRALAKEPGERYQSAREFHEALLRAAGADPAPVSAPAALASAAAPLPAAAPPAAASTGPHHAPTTARDETVLRTIERELARYLGPVARVLVKNAAAKTDDVGELSAMLAQSIDDPAARHGFVAALRTAAVGGSLAPRDTSLTRAAVSVPHAPAALPQAFVDEAIAKLTRCLGPIARVVAKKALREAASERDFVQMLAKDLDPERRRRFLDAMGLGEID